MNQNEHILELIKSKVLKKDPDAEVILFGSHARGDSKIDSDWDILILLNRPNVSKLIEKEFQDEIFDIELQIDQPISVFVYSKNDWERQHSITPLYQNIQLEGIHI